MTEYKECPDCDGMGYYEVDCDRCNGNAELCECCSEPYCQDDPKNEDLNEADDE